MRYLGGKSRIAKPLTAYLLGRQEGKGMQRTKSFQLYVLVAPRNGEVRYLGKTTGPLARRLKQHLSKKEGRNSTHKNNWIKSLEGLRPGIQLFQDFGEHLEYAKGECPVGEVDWNEVLSSAEVHWIAKLREQGVRLTNGTAGGDGMDGATQRKFWASLTEGERKALAPTDAWRASHQRAMQALAKDPEWLAKTKDAARARHADPAKKEQHRQATQRAAQRPAWRDANRQMLQARAKDPQHLAKMRELPKDPGWQLTHALAVLRKDAKKRATKASNALAKLEEELLKNKRPANSEPLGAPAAAPSS